MGASEPLSPAAFHAPFLSLQAYVASSQGLGSILTLDSETPGPPAGLPCDDSGI